VYEEDQTRNYDPGRYTPFIMLTVTCIV